MTKNINVLQVADYHAPYRGNFIASLETLHLKLEEYNSKVIYLFPVEINNFLWIKEFKEKGYIVYFFTDNIIENLLLIIKIKKKYNIDIFHMHFRNIKISLAVTLAHLLFKKTKYFTHMHGQYKKSFFLKEYFRRIARLGTHYIGCSYPVTEELIESGINKKKVTCVENAVDFRRLNQSREILNSELNLDENVKKILMFGYNWYIKGVDIALDAVSELIKNNEKVVLLISVASNKEKLLQLIIKKYGEMPKWIVLLEPINDIASYYHLSDIFISPSREEGFCYSLIEAAYCKVPIIASDIPAQKSLMLIGDIWINKGNSENLRDKLQSILYIVNEKKLQYQKNLVVTNYDLKKWTREIINVYYNF